MTFLNKPDNASAHTSTSYDALIRSTIPYYDFFHIETVSLVKSIMSSPRLWLDTGCGTGNLVVKTLNEFPDTRFFLADPSREMLVVAKSKIRNTERVVFLAPISTQELRSVVKEKFDVITAIQAHHYLSLDERRAATETCCELINENGVYVTFENVRPSTKRAIDIEKAKWATYQIANGRSRKDACGHIDRFDKDYFPITIEDHLQLYRNCGFGVAELFWYSYMQAGFYCLKAS
jgi:tRNA (cmo5U34)-methyltransferase